MASAIEQSTRVTDPVGRLGGDEFLVFMLARNANEARTITQQIQRALHGEKITIGRQPISVTFSAALIPIYGEHGVPPVTSVTALLRLGAMYLKHAKRQGKNRVIAMRVDPTNMSGTGT